MHLEFKSSLRYGESPHQNAAFYVDKSISEVNAGGIATAIQHHGKVMQSTRLKLLHPPLLSSRTEIQILFYILLSISIFFNDY